MKVIFQSYFEYMMTYLLERESVMLIETVKYDGHAKNVQIIETENYEERTKCNIRKGGKL